MLIVNHLDYNVKSDYILCKVKCAYIATLSIRLATAEHVISKPSRQSIYIDVAQVASTNIQNKRHKNETIISFHYAILRYNAN